MMNKKTVLRVQSGALRGRGLQSPPDSSVRPTSARVKESLFNILRPRLAGARFLDLFCGTGQIGLEAASNGAKPVFVDADARLVRNNILPLLPQAEIAEGDFRAVLQTFAAQKRSFDFIFADPPYRDGLYEDIVRLCEPLLGEDGVLVLEHASDYTIPSVVPFRTRVYGSRSLSFTGDFS